MKDTTEAAQSARAAKKTTTDLQTLERQIHLPFALPIRLTEDEPRPCVGIPEIVLFQDANFGGAEWRTNLSYTWVGSDWNDRVSSLIVVSGTWLLYEHANFAGVVSNALTPGYYPWVEDGSVNMANDSISSFKVIDWRPDCVAM